MSTTITPFSNEPFTDFTLERERKAFAAALTQLEETLSHGPLTATPMINGISALTDEIYERKDPSDGETIIGKTSFASVSQAEEALASLSLALPTWRATPVDARATILENAATLMKERKASLAALIIREAGKPWREADADVAEAIDFCRYYALEARRLLTSPLKTMEVAGEENWYLYEPRGIAAVISPWNFPLAIACGMTVAALVTGNVVAFKPAEQTSIVGHALASILFEAGLPRNVLAFLPGAGERVGRALVSSPLTSLICFTGSRAVGLEILSQSAQISAHQRHLKKVILELGGKNALVIDEDADLDEAIKGAIYSVFGYAGQKCSACSRIIIVGSAYETFVSRFVEATKSLIIGKAATSNTLLGPVVDRESQTRLSAAIAQASSSCTLAFKGEVPASGYFVPPTIYRDVPRDTPLWTDELFGPIVALQKGDTFEEAITLAVDSEYALTGGVFTRSPRAIEYAKKHFTVGNLYINRGCTGALVCRQPFGGAKMSGIGSKAGGPDYLLQFVEPRAYTENTMRRGFTPETR